MSDAFRTLLKKVGSGAHTSDTLSREEAATATRLMLQGEATPAQIGAFMIAHRIRRPEPVELAGMLDAYDQLGPALAPTKTSYLPTIFSMPYDGRSRTAPVSPLTTLILLAAKAPVVLHGGDRMPTKYGLPLIEIWQKLGLPLHLLNFDQAQQLFAATGFGFVYQPNHFPMAQTLVPYRDQIGKRPTIATVELMWSPCCGSHHLVMGFVHPPTEDRAQITYALREQSFYTTVKGLEGSCDLPRSRTAIIGLMNPGSTELERLLLHPRDFGLAGKDVSDLPVAELAVAIESALAGEITPLAQSAIWNGGFYLWRCGAADSIDAGLTLAKALLTDGKAQTALNDVKQAIASLTAIPVAP
ncbi:MAG: anthranilate phosphoribosyltransferase family protein [Cyanobacteria bacterium P01_H01_bin.119]